MTDIQLAHLSFGGEGRDHNREHLVAIRDARIATDIRSGDAPSVTRAGATSLGGLVSRFRLAVAGGPAMTTEACNCPA